MKYTPQCLKVIGHIERWGSLNSIEAIRHYGITRLAARTHDLKETPRAMKAIPAVNAENGFVNYVPDFEKRRVNLKRRHVLELLEAEGIGTIAEVSSRYAAKFMLLDIKEREHV